MIAHGLPVVAAFRAGTGMQPLANLLLLNIVPVGRLAGDRIDAGEDVLENGFLVAEEFSGDPVELPENPRLADRKHQLLSTVVDKNALEHFVEIERFTGDVL